MTAPTPSIPTFTDGTVVHQAALSALASNLTNLYNYALGGFITSPAFCITNQTSAQSIGNANYIAISFTNTIVNNGNMWVASQPSQLTVQTAGTYLLWSQIAWAGNTAGYRGAAITVNGTVVPNNSVAGQNIPNNPGGYVTSQCVALYRLAAGATIYSMGWQNTGASLNTDTGSLINSSLAALWLSQ